jgi:hypothetical protein
VKDILIFILVSVIPLIIDGCFNPFFPEKGTPPRTESSPERTVQLLKEAYEQKDIYLFENLIYLQSEFSSYTEVSEDYSMGLGKISFAPKVFIDTIFAANRFLPQNRYYFELKWADEHNIHERMFKSSEEIVFLMPFSAAAGGVQYEIAGGDTVSALVKTQSSQMRVRYEKNDFTVDVTGQVFAMKKSNGVWKIWKWIELN